MPSHRDPRVAVLVFVSTLACPLLVPAARPFFAMFHRLASAVQILAALPAPRMAPALDAPR